MLPLSMANSFFPENEWFAQSNLTDFKGVFHNLLIFYIINPEHL